MNIYELTDKYKVLEMAVRINPDNEELKVEYEKITDDVETKAENYAKIIKNLEAEQKALMDESKRLSDRAGVIKNNIKSLKDNLMWSMEQTNKTKFKTDLFAFSISKNGGLAPLEVSVGVDELPEELRKVTVEPDTTAIRKYIEETGDLSYGFFKDKGHHLTIR